MCSSRERPGLGSITSLGLCSGKALGPGLRTRVALQLCHVQLRGLGKRTPHSHPAFLLWSLGPGSPSLGSGPSFRART